MSNPFPDKPPDVGDLLNRRAPGNNSNVDRGGTARGVWLNISMNLLLCVLWLPVCGLEMVVRGGDSDLAMTNFVFGAIRYIGVVQFVHVVPIGLRLAAGGQRRTLSGMIWAALVTLLVWLFLYVGNRASF